MSKTNINLLILVASLGFLLFVTSCSPRNLIRNNTLARNIFYPNELQADFAKGNGLAENTPGEMFDNSDYAYLLSKNVDASGKVNYIGIKKEEAVLDMYLESISKAQYDKLSRYEKLAFLINAYNAFTLKLIIENPGIDSIKDIPSAKRWENQRWSLAGEKISLLDLEHERIRKEFGEPRIHFALVCAAKGCPKLRNGPYRGRNLAEQLEDQALHFFSQDQNLKWDSEKNELYLSEILDWFRYDFADDESGVVNHSLQYVDESTAREIGNRRDSVKIKYIPYDWKLNGIWN